MKGDKPDFRAENIIEYTLDNFKSDYYDDAPSRRHGGTSYSVYVNPRDIRFVTRVREVGMTNNKIWSKWRKTHLDIYYKCNDGRMAAKSVVFLPKKPNKFAVASTGYEEQVMTLSFRNNTPMQPSTQAQWFLKAAFRDQFGMDLDWRNFYPLAEHYGFISDPSLSMAHGLATMLRCRNAMELTQWAFGKSNYRKDLVRSVANSSIQQISIARNFRNRVPIDWIRDFLLQETGFERGFFKFAVPDFRNVLNMIDPRSYRDLLRAEDWRYNVRDLFRCNRVEGRYRNWVTLHDNAVGPQAFHYSKPFEHKDIDFSHAKLDLPEYIGPYRFVLPTRTETLQDWGQAMRNCIFSYANDAIEGRTILGGIYKEDKLLANLEIRGNRLTQFLGPCNQAVPTIRDVVVPEFSKRGIIVDQYWGKQDA